MKLFKYLVLGLILLNIPSATLVYVNPVLATILSYSSFLLMVLFYMFNTRSAPNKWMIIIGISYFTISIISGQSYVSQPLEYIIFAGKYFIYVICGYEVLKRTSEKELYVFLLIGALTIILQVMFFNDPFKDSGRYSGFYLNPNSGGFMCFIGYALTFAIKNRKFRLLGQIVFTIMGMLTFSRTFFIIWIFINIISIWIDVKNIRVLLYGFGLLTVFVIYSEFLPVQNIRLKQLSAIMEGGSVKSKDLGEDSRTDTWGSYYNAIYERPFFGNGFGSFSGRTNLNAIGVHNAYLKVLGEAGILVFMVFIGLYFTILKDSIKLFKKAPHILLISIALILYLLTNHDYFDTGYLLFISMWIQWEIEKGKKEQLLAHGYVPITEPIDLEKIISE